jgi:hypothetical protein
MTAPTPAPGAPANPTAAALQDYRRLMFRLHDLARAAERIPALPDHYRALAAAITKLSGLRPHIVGGGYAEPDDAKAIAKDLEAIWFSVDPLILAIGQELKSNFDGVDLREFTEQLRGALEGNATHECESAAERLTEEEPFVDPNREHVPRRM